MSSSITVFVSCASGPITQVLLKQSNEKGPKVVGTIRSNEKVTFERKLESCQISIKNLTWEIVEDNSIKELLIKP